MLKIEISQDGLNWEYFAKEGLEFDNKFYYPAIEEISDIEIVNDNGFIKVNYGEIKLNRDYLEDIFNLFERKYKVKIYQENKKIFDDIGVRIGLDNFFLTLRLYSSFEYETELLQEIEIDGEKRLKPLALGFVEKVKPLIIDKNNWDLYRNSQNIITKCNDGIENISYTDNLINKSTLWYMPNKELTCDIKTLKFGTGNYYTMVPIVNQIIKVTTSETSATIRVTVQNMGSSGIAKVYVLYAIKDTNLWIKSSNFHTIYNIGNFDIVISGLIKATNYEFKAYVEDYNYPFFNVRYGNLTVLTNGTTITEDIYSEIAKKENVGVAETKASEALSSAKKYTDDSLKPVNTDISKKLSKAGDTIEGGFTFTSTGNILIGTETSGIKISPNGILAKKNSVNTFALNSTGDAVFYGELASNSGYFGNVKIFSTKESLNWEVSIESPNRQGIYIKLINTDYWGFFTNGKGYFNGGISCNGSAFIGAGATVQGGLTISTGALKVGSTNVSLDGHTHTTFNNDITIGASGAQKSVTVYGILGAYGLNVNGTNVSLEGHTHTTFNNDITIGASGAQKSVTVYGILGAYGLKVNGTNVSLEGHTHSNYITDVDLDFDATGKVSALYVKYGTNTYWTRLDLNR